MNKPTNKFQKVCLLLFTLAIVNFILFFIISLIIGGTAISGFVSDGHYYVKDHGKITETSSFVWYFSKIHSISVFITHPVGIIAVIFYNISKYISKRNVQK